MFRPGVRFAAFLLSVSMIAMIAVSTGSYAQHPGRAAPAAPAARPAAPPAMARPAPPPAMARPAPPPPLERPAAPAFRPAPPPQRPAMAPRPMPHIAAPPRPSAPRIAAPSHPSAPPSVRARPSQQDRIGQREQRIQQLQQTRQGRQRDVPSRQSVQRQDRIDRLQQRSLQTEQRQLQREQRVQRLQQTAQERQRDTLSRQSVQRKDRIDRLQQRVQQLQSQQPQGRREQRAQQRLLQTQQRVLRHEEGLQQRTLARQQHLGIPPSAARPADAAAAQAAARGRFATRFASADRQAEAARADRHQGWAPRHAWRHGLRAAFVPWAGHVFWPYAYSDIFEYTFWPYAYDPGYWAYAYDDFVDTVFWGADGPYSAYARLGPGDPESGDAITGSRPRERASVSPQALRQLCGDPEKGITAWPFASIVQAVRPTPEQRALLDELKSAAAKAADAFKESCGDSYAMTPPGRLRAMTNRISATLEAVRIVRPVLEKFYSSLSDEQQARFNALGPNIGERLQAQPQQEANAQPDSCGEPKSGLTNLPIERIEAVIRPESTQKDALDRLKGATDKAVQGLQAACPDSVPLTPVGRLEAMEKRLAAMLQAAKLVQPALDEFYATLSSEQKARFNGLAQFAGP